jgi:hypothetical protein
MKSKLLSVFVVIMAGCGGDSGTPAPSDNRPIQGAVSPPQPAAPVDTSPSDTPEQLVEKFKSAFTAGNLDAIQKLTHIEGQPPNSDPHLVANGMTNYWAGKAQIIDVKIQPAEEKDILPHFTLTPKQVLNYEAKNVSGVRMSLVLPIVEVDQHFYFYRSFPKANP